MKGSSSLVASVVAVSTVALMKSSPSNQGSSSLAMKNGEQNSNSTSDKEKFKPRFDGLRFIETLVTAHR
ncbi:hypothetical protein ACFX19_033195 [Malus domestica]